MSTTTTTTSTAVPATPSAAVPPTAPVPAQPLPTEPITSTANGGNRGTKVELQASYQAFVTGLLASYQPTDTFELDVGSITRDELIAEVNAYIAAAEATKADLATYRTAVQTERSAEARARALRRGVARILQVRLGESNPALLSFGIPPRKARVVRPASQVAAIAKAKATRAARGTKGSVQNAAIHGDVSGVVVTPIVVQPAPQATPAPSAPPAGSASGSAPPRTA